MGPLCRDKLNSEERAEVEAVRLKMSLLQAITVSLLSNTSELSLLKKLLLSVIEHFKQLCVFSTL